MTTVSLKRNDLLPPIVGTLRNANGTAVDLTGSSVRMLMCNSRGLLKVNAPATVTTPASGVVRYDWIAGDTNTAGLFRGELEVTFPSGKIETFPNRGYITLVIEEDVDISDVPDASVPSILDLVATLTARVAVLESRSLLAEGT